MINIIVPTINTDYDKMQIEDKLKNPCNIIISQSNGSASQNRNAGLNSATGKYIIMVDDDIAGFYFGWESDLIAPVMRDKYLIVSARLLNRDGSFAEMQRFERGNDESDIVYTAGTPAHIFPSAAIAFYDNGIRFDENYERGGWEDTDFFFQSKKIGCEFAINNRCKLIHKNENKWNVGDTNEKNRKYFYRKWYGIK